MTASSTATKASQVPVVQFDEAAIATAFRDIVAELGGQFFERREVLEALVVTVLARQHAFLLGPPGTAKTELCRAICNRIIGARFWSILFDRQLGKEEVFGPIDLAKYDKTGKWERNIEDTIADCHLAFGDEAGKAGPSVMNQLLTALNERQFKPNGAWIDLPLVSFIGASNELFEPELAAIWDRFLVRLKVDYLQEPGNFAAMLSTAVKRNGQPVTTVTLEELEYVTRNVIPAIPIPPGVIDTILQLRLDLRAEQIVPSDRRYKQAMSLLQASAFMRGGAVVDEDDLPVLRYVLWDDEKQITKVEEKVLKLSSEFTRKALEFMQMIDDWNKGIDDRRSEPDQAKAAYGGEIQYKVSETNKELATLIELANREGRSIARLDAVRVALRALKVKVYTECMKMDEKRAERMADKAGDGA